MVFGHLEVLHSKFHDRTISNLGDYVAQTDRQTDRQTDKQTDNAIYIVDCCFRTCNRNALSLFPTFPTAVQVVQFYVSQVLML